MNDRLPVALSCAGEFVAALQIAAALPGLARLPRRAAAAPSSASILVRAAAVSASV